MEMLFNFALGYAIRMVQVNQDGLKLNGAHQLLFYADDVNTLEGSKHNIKKNPEAQVVASKETGLEVNADKIKYMVMSRDQNAGRSRSISLIIVPLRAMKGLYIWEQNQQIKILFRKKLRAG